MESLVFWFLVVVTVMGYVGGNKGIGFVAALLTIGCACDGVSGVIGVVAFGLFVLTPLAILLK